MATFPVASITWRRVDVPGRDVARLLRADDGWLLAGVAAWSDDGGASRLDYVVSLDARWRTLRCSVDGVVGARSVAIALVRSADGVWTLNGEPVASVEGCDDIDLSFTPATNLLPIRRLALEVSAGATVRAAWLRVPELTLEPLEQRYARTDATTYAYESDGGAFRRTLSVDPSGFVIEYPGLWTAESVESTDVVTT